jgi:hypothetical protein
MTEPTFQITNLRDLSSEVARQASHKNNQLCVVDAQCVLACFFDVMVTMEPSFAAKIMAAGLKKAEERAAK